MSSEPKIYHGEWWVPAEADPNRSIFMTAPVGHEKRHTGTLTYYEDDDSILELYHIPSDFHATHNGNNQVMWGITANGMVFTLFNVVMEKNFSGDFTKTKFTVGLILVGEHVISLQETRYIRCVVQFCFLQDWAFHDNIVHNIDADSASHHIVIDSSKVTAILESQVDSNFKWLLRDKLVLSHSTYDLNVNQTTEFVIDAGNAVSIGTFLKHIREFSQFLSVAVYCKQTPADIKIYRNKRGFSSQLLFKIDKSENPYYDKLIQFDQLKNKVPSMFRIWHQNYDKIAPISGYLIDSLRKKNAFNVPDFLIIAQALDGYHKRFVNKKNGKDIQKYEEQIKVLLNQFKDVNVIQECNIDPVVLKDTRHKYSHLYPDDEKSKAVEGEELYWLTEKCKILLTCCILNMMGLANAEINLCYENSPITEMIKSNPFEFE